MTLRADWTPLAGHRVSGGVNIVGSQRPDFANACRMPAYTTADARYAVQVKNMEWSFGVNNLFDRDFYTQAFGCAGMASKITQVHSLEAMQKRYDKGELAAKVA